VTPSQNPGRFSTPLIGCFDCCGPVYEGDLLDVRKFESRYKIAVEDPQFKGSACPWHYVVCGKRGTISPSGPNSYWVSFGPERSDEDHSFKASQLRDYLRIIKAIRK
jgi:hypothetical protein